MSTKTKAAFAIIVTLCIGALIGAPGHGAYLSSQDKKVRAIPPAKFFVADLERTIQPDEKQRDAVSKILAMRSAQITAIMERHLQEIAAVVDSAKNDLVPVLSEEQRRRLNERLEKGMFGTPRMATPDQWAGQLKERLALTGGQFQEVQKLLDASQKEIAALLDSRRDNPGSIRDSMTAIMRGMDTRIKSLLTPEQKKKFEELRNERFRFSPGEFPPPTIGREQRN